MALEWINKGSPTCDKEVVIEKDGPTRLKVTCTGCRLEYTAPRL